MKNICNKDFNNKIDFLISSLRINRCPKDEFLISPILKMGKLDQSRFCSISKIISEIVPEGAPRETKARANMDPLNPRTEGRWLN